VEVKYGNQK